MSTEPLGQPRGSVRAILALMIVGGFIVGHLGAMAVLFGFPVVGLEEPNTEAGLAVLAALAIESATVSTFYFATRPS